MTTPAISSDVRYDRQIRLWGADTQKGLQSTHLYLYGAQAEASELAKNLVLAGVKAVTVMDSSPIDVDDEANNFLVRRVALSRQWASRGEAVAASLRHLNPEVCVSHAPPTRARVLADAYSLPQSALAMCVYAAPIQSLRDAYAAVQPFDAPAVRSATDAPAVLLLLSVRCSTQLVVTLCLHTRRQPPLSLTAQLDTLLRDRATLSRQHAALQQAVLSLHLTERMRGLSGDTASPWRTRCACGLLAATQLVSELDLHALPATSVAAVVSRVAESADADALDASTTTLAGAALAQFVVRQIAAHVSSEAAEMYGWIACDGGDDMAVLVGP